MRENVELKRTTNRSVYNKLYKKHLERIGKIRCSICAVHRGENDDNKWYGTIHSWRNEGEKVRYPSWKLTSKNRKQWMKSPLKFKTKAYRYSDKEYVEIKW